ncbi:hypothetical protein B0T26DRAFT_302153 [Lasiosphaeria miniovina]|uniref:Uncharacterized protein n=1 Tax=Lasiosphaeria miniovina TaxID=1954250 RepID=A0AA40AKT2_9PEZI|nr:uncharacterized protein B0T26DRAFT_302153 [Lasiosphaeria miniovina]KAK0717685.1 hypothetical protein B0T26DRAFT_302153 [Lasiosphaeria miniovina]
MRLAAVLILASGLHASRALAKRDDDGPSCYPLPASPTSTTSRTRHPPPLTTTSLAASCTYKPTQTFYSSSGCPLTCGNEFCVIDAAVTIPCGCPRVDIQPTTVTVCPTQTPCYQCYTGWGTFLVTQTCPQTASLPTHTSEAVEMDED